MNKLNSLLNPDIILKNTFLSSLLGIFVTMYGPRLSPKLPESLQTLYDNIAFRAVVIFLVVYLVNKNFQLALVLTIIFVVTINLLQNKKIENFMSSEFGKPVSSCDNYSKEQIEKDGSAFYSLGNSENIYN